MSNVIFSEKEAYKFLKVEEYFDRYKEWEKLLEVKSHGFDADSKTLTLNFSKSDGNPCSILMQFPQQDTFRLRFNPGKTAEDYSSKNSPSVVLNNFEDLTRLLDNNEHFEIEVIKDVSNGIELVTKNVDNNPEMKVVVNHQPFSITVYMFAPHEEYIVWQTADTPIYYTPNGNNNYAIIQAVNKPANAKYVGFGEQGGQSLSKNTAQVNYFNFDNMRYRQVYDRGPLDPREPLYHSEPFFYEFHGVPEHDSVTGVFIDNTGQVLVDIGYINSSRYMIGTRFGDLDFYFFIGHNPANILDSYTEIVGRPRLKPRYCLGYQQGCYGYERQDIVEWAVRKHREYQIPLDGMHVDVDIQKNYQTFTIDTEKFPNPYEMFHNLKEQGVKCSTNITPVISRLDPNYSTYAEAKDKGFFVMDRRYDPGNPDSKIYQLYGSGHQFSPNNGYVEGFNSGEPYIGGVYYGNDSNGNELGTPGHYADLGRQEVRDWWGTQYKYLYSMGLEMVWQDMTTPAIRDYRGDMKGFPFRLLVTDNSHSDAEPKLTPAIEVWNLYSYNLHKATYQGLNRLHEIKDSRYPNLSERKNKRNFIIGRGSFSGVHRYAGLWNGDNSSDWDFLKMNVSQVLSLGLCGLAINGQDIGGFEASAVDEGKWASPELLIRWTAAGAFLPWFRNHYVRKGRKEFQEPFMYVEWFNQYQSGKLPEPQNLYRMVLPICKHYIELRYRLMQLFYDGMFENSLNGLPISRPLFINDPGDQSLYNDKEAFLDNEFFVGKDLLIAPVLDPQEPQSIEKNYGKRDVYVPYGSDWYCFMNNTMPLGSVVEGGTTIRDFDASLNLEGDHINFIVPIYVRAGAIIPTIELEQYVGQLNKEGKPNPITLNVYPGVSGKYTMFLDDGVSRSSAFKMPPNSGWDEEANDEYRRTEITHRYPDQKTREINVKRVHDGYTPKLETYFFVAVLHDPSETKGASGCLKSVKIAEQSIPQVQGSSNLNSSPQNAWYYNESINISFVKVFDNSPDITITADYF
ncbi:TIM-barrel domain-containing protein [Nostoc sp. PCC 9305]|uniref:glycoside hydrolase family 31 protein n=1 Tax=Nostoc sp. PCC 9305 TaxID=296636 RepID=UPI0039C6B4E6